MVVNKQAKIAFGAVPIILLIVGFLAAYVFATKVELSEVNTNAKNGINKLELTIEQEFVKKNIFLIMQKNQIKMLQTLSRIEEQIKNLEKR